MLYLRAVPNKIVSLSRRSHSTFSNPTLGLEIQTFFAFFLGILHAMVHWNLDCCEKKVKAESIEKSFKCVEDLLLRWTPKRLFEKYLLHLISIKACYLDYHIEKSWRVKKLGDDTKRP